jgi:hypothetical protein
MGFLNIPWWIWGSLALVIASIYAFYVPKAESVYATRGFQFVVVRWFHSLVWIILALSFFMRAVEQKVVSDWANPVAMIGGILYVIFFIAYIQLK